MLSAASAAILAGACLAVGLIGAARADTDLTTASGPLSTSTAGNIIIEASGSVSVASTGGAAITLNSGNAIFNDGGTINASGLSSAYGIHIDTSGGNIVSALGVVNEGNIDLTGAGTAKVALLVDGGNIYYGSINLESVPTTSASANGTVVTVNSGSAIGVQGDISNVLDLVQGTTMDGDIKLSGSMVSNTSKDSLAAGLTAIYLEGKLNGNFVIDNLGSVNVVGNQARGVWVLGPIGPCDSAALTAVGETCALNTNGVTFSTGAFVNAGSIEVLGTATPNIKGGNLESGSAVVIANSIAGGFLNNGSSTATSGVTAVISANGVQSASGTFPTLLIDPAQSITASQTTPRGPVVLGPISSVIDPVDPGYSFINRGTISAFPTDFELSAVAVVIQGASAVNYTCLGVVTGGVCSAASTSGNGGLLDTGTISAQAATNVKTDSSLSATALAVGAYTTIPRVVVSGELVSSNAATPGTIASRVIGPGGGTATAVQIAAGGLVPEIDVLQHGTISASVVTTTTSPTSDFANAATPFQQFSTAIVDQSGYLLRVNNAGTIVAANTVQTVGTAATVYNITQAINLVSNTSGGVIINNSGVIRGDIYFGAAGNNDTLNVGNVGTVGTDSSHPAAGAAANSYSTLDSTGNGNAAICTVQTSCVVNTAFNYATVSGILDSQANGAAPVTEANAINFGAGINETLHVGGFGYVDSVITAAPGALDVQVDNHGILIVANTAANGSLNANHLDIKSGGTLGLTISQNTSVISPVVLASNEATIEANANLGINFGSFISSGTTAATITHPTAQVITLISAPLITVDPNTLTTDNQLLVQNIPFLFESPLEAGSTATTPLKLVTPASGNQTLTLSLTPRAPGKTNADGTAGLGLSGDALAFFPNVAQALSNDVTLGSAIATNLTVYNTNGVSTSGINIAASQQRAQQVFSQFTPDVSGGSRQVAIMLTDQATGPVAARQRLLRSYGDQSGDLTLWGQEFVGNINNKGRVSADGTLTNYKDHGFGFVLGMDAGSARDGWYGGALTYYSGDVSETLPRQSLTHEQWYILTGYTDWHGKHVFFDTQLNAGYASMTGNRGLTVGNQSRIAQEKHAGLVGSLGGTAGVLYNLGKHFQILPQISLDGMSMREEGYTEGNGGDGLNLAVAPYYANSLRTFLGADFKGNFNVWDTLLSPDVRVGYRYDLIKTPVKLRAGFASTGGLSAPGNVFTFVGPDPDTGNFVLGAGLRAGTDTWSLGFDFDWVHGNNGSVTQVGMLNLLGRI
jgi:hypothetical protein